MTDRYLAIIPARAGSKRLVNKNALDLGGKPLFIWSVLAGLACRSVDKVIVSTDSPAYQALAVETGADCPRLRSPDLSTDDATSAEVVMDVLAGLGKEIEQYEAFVLLQPTSPLRTSEDVSAAISLYESREVPAVVSVCETECPIEKTGRLGDDLSMDAFTSGNGSKRGQDLPTGYRLNGAIYVVNIQHFIINQDFVPVGSRAYIMPRERSIDIDTRLDFLIAQAILDQADA